MRSKSRRGYKAAHRSLFIATPQSRLTPCQLPVRGAFWCGANSNQKLSPQAGKVDTNGVSGRKGNGSKMPSYLAVPPQTIRLTAYCQLPRKRWRLIVRFTSLHIKPALKGEVDFAKQKPEGLKKERGFACYRQPLSQTFGLPAPRKGEPYEERISLLAQAPFFDAEIHRRSCVGEKSQTFSLFRR